MLKILIANIIALPRMKKLWSRISDSLYQELPYAIVSTGIAHLPELQHKDPMAQTI